MVAHPNRWLAKPGELLLAENVVVENDLLQKEPASAYYDLDGVDLLALRGTLSLSVNFLAGAAWFAATVPPATPVPNTRLGITLSAASATPGTPWLVSMTKAVPVGALHAVRVTTVGNPRGATVVTDARGNFYTNVVDQENTDFTPSYRGQIFVAEVTTALQIGDQVTIQLNGPVTPANAVGSASTGVSLPVRLLARFGTAGSPSAVISAFSAAHSPTYPAIGVAFLMSTDATVVPTVALPFVLDATPTSGSGHRTWSYSTDAFYSYTAIAAQTEWQPDETSTPAGTVSVTANTTTVAGVGTAFTTNFRAGDIIMVAGQRRIVRNTTSAVLMTVTEAWTVTQTAVAYQRLSGPVLVTVINHEENTTATMWKELPVGNTGTQGHLKGTALVTTLGKLATGRFVVAGKEAALRPRKLFYFNGYDPVQVVDGDATTAHAITKPAADWGTVVDITKQPINGIVHQDSLVAFGNLNDPHRVYVSTPDDHEDFQTTAAPAVPTISLRIASNVGQRLYGVAQFQGVLFFWKYPHGIFYLDDTAADRFQWNYRIRSMALGCAPTPYAVLATDDDVLFCDAQGHFHLLSAVNTLGGTRDSDITRALGLQRWTEENIEITSLPRMTSVYDDQTKTAWFGLRSRTAPSQQNDLVVRWDFSLVANNGPLRMTTARCWTPNVLTLKHHDWWGRQAVIVSELGNSWFVIPGSYGYRVTRDAIAAADVSVGIPTTVTLPQLTGKEEHRVIRKQFIAYEAIFQDTVSTTEGIEVELSVDGAVRQTFPLRANGGLLRRQVTRTLNAGEGYSVSARLTTDGSLTTDCGLVGLVVYYQPTDTDESRRS